MQKLELISSIGEFAKSQAGGMLGLTPEFLAWITRTLENMGISPQEIAAFTDALQDLVAAGTESVATITELLEGLGLASDVAETLAYCIMLMLA